MGCLFTTTNFSSNFALKFVNYPFMVLAKSAKILPVVFMSVLRGVIVLKASQMVIAVAITLGLVLFNSNKIGGVEDESTFGILLVMVSLLFDGFVSSQQDKNHQTSKRGFAYHTMLYNNLVSLVINLAIFGYQAAQGDDTVDRLQADSSLLGDTFVLALCGAFG